MEAPIEGVRVFGLGATVTRIARFEGENPDTAEITGLPLSLIDGTVRVRSLSDGLVAGAVRVGLHAKPPEQTPDTPDEQALRDTERRMAHLSRTLELIEAECALLGRIEVPERPRSKTGKPPLASPMAARVALQRFTDEAIETRLVEARGIKRDLARLDEEAAALRDAIRRAGDAHRARPDALTKSVHVALRGRVEGASLAIEYFVPGARWAPQYQLDIDPDGSRAEIRMRALICQASGEDWRGVELELSTAEAHRFTELPELSSIRIGKAQPVPLPRGFRPAPRGSEALFVDFDRDRQATRRTLALPKPRAIPSLHAEPLSPFFPPEAMAFGAGGTMEADALELDEESAAVARVGAAPPAGPVMESAVMSAAAPRRRMAKKKGRPPAGPTGRREAAPEPATPGRSRVAFAGLSLPAPSSGLRGRLRAGDALAFYEASLRRTGLRADFDVRAVVGEARRQAEAAASIGLPAGAASVREAAGHFDYAYAAEDRVDVPSDRGWHSVPLGRRTAECAVTYVVVPREDPNVFRVASVTNPSRAPMLPGPAEVYVGGEYVLSTTLPTVAPGQRFRLGLGVEQGIRTARNTTFREERAGRNVVAMTELHHTIAIEVHNQLGRDVSLEVRERIPQPAPDAEVDVEEVRVAPPWETWDQRPEGERITGGRRWSVTVGGGERTTLEAHYVVKIYANNELVGGNRREA